MIKLNKMYLKKLLLLLWDFFQLKNAIKLSHTQFISFKFVYSVSIVE